MSVENVRIIYSIEDGNLDELLAKFGKLSASEQEQLRNMQKIDAQTTQTVSNQNNQYNGLNKTIANIKNTIVAAFALDKIISFGKEVINTTATFQKFEAVLTNTLGSSSKAQKAMQMLVDFATKTPFSVEELTSSFVKLANAGFKPTEAEMTKLGDLASSTGKSFDDLTEAILDAQTGEFERLKEFGVRANKEGDNVRFTFKGVETQVKGTEAEIRKYVLSLGSLQGVSGSMAAISRTLGGQISNLGDSFQQLQLAIGELGSKGFSTLVSGISSFIQGITSYIKIPYSQKVREEKEELNFLVSAIKNTNTSNEVRKVLIEELNEKYPQFTKTVDISKASDKELQKALEATNKEYEKRIFILTTQEIVQDFEKKRIDSIKREAEAVKNLEKAKKGIIIDVFGYESFAAEEAGLQLKFGIYQKRIKAEEDYRKRLQKEKESTLKSIEIIAKKEGVDVANARVEANKKEVEVNKEKISIDKKAQEELAKQRAKAQEELAKQRAKAQEELAKQRADFDLRELEAQQKLAQEKIKNEIELNNLVLQNENTTNTQKIEIIRENQNLETQLFALQNTQKKKQYEIDKNNVIQTKKLTQSEILAIDTGTGQQQKVLAEKVFNQLDALQITNIEDDVSWAKKRKEEILEMEQDIAKEQLKITNDLIDKQIKAYEKKQEKEQQIKEKAVELGESIADFIFQYQQNRLTKELENVQTQKDYELQLAGDNKNKQIEINNRFAEKEREIKNKQAQADKSKAVFDILTSTSVGIVKALATANIPLSVLIGGLGLIQLLQVQSRPIPKFRKGIDYLDLPTNGTDSDGMIIEAHKGERILPTYLNERIKDIPNIKIPELVMLGLYKTQNTASGYYPTKQDFKEAVKEGISQIPFTNVQINENGFETWVTTQNSKTKFFNKNSSW